MAALRARAAAEEAAVALALKEYYPDFEAMAAYDAWWQPRERDLRPMVGVRLNLPIRTDRRDAAVAEAQARVAQRRAELARAIDQAGLQVQEAYEQAREAERALQLYQESALPAARENIRLAQSSYTTGKVPFLSLIEAQRNLVELRDRQFELQAEARRRRAALDRATGATTAPAPAAAPEILPPVKLSNPRYRDSHAAAPARRPPIPRPEGLGSPDGIPRRAPRRQPGDKMSQVCHESR